jgi:adenosylmethionine-8-amino-7-oxononanoate aminotransferase
VWTLSDGSRLHDLSGATLLETVSAMTRGIPAEHCASVLPSFGFDTALRAALERDVLELAGPAYPACLWAASGSDGMEIALWAVAGTYDVTPFDVTYFVRRGAYHGATALTRELSSRLPHKTSKAISVVRLNETGCHDRWADELIEGLEEHRQLPRPVVIVEPISTSAITFWPGCEQLTRLSTWCRYHRIPMIFDEVASGAYRNGWFSLASVAEGIRPDAYVLAKGLTSGVVPLSCCVFREDLAQMIRARGDKPPGFTVALNDVSAYVARERLANLRRVVSAETFGEGRARVSAAAREISKLSERYRAECSDTSIRVIVLDRQLRDRLRDLLIEREMWVYSTEVEWSSTQKGWAYMICPRLDAALDQVSIQLNRLVDTFGEAVSKSG